MPCFDPRADDERITALQETKQQSELFEAMLCGVMTSIENNVGPNMTRRIFEGIDYEEGGFSNRRLVLWWRKHKREDEQRRIIEQKKISDRATRAGALAKLTPEEKLILGVK